MIAACRKCGKLVEMTTEEAYTPLWSCGKYDRICDECYMALNINMDPPEAVCRDSLSNARSLVHGPGE